MTKNWIAPIKSNLPTKMAQFAAVVEKVIHFTKKVIDNKYLIISLLS